MAELILPLCRTLFLPVGCPGLGSVEAVSGDLRDVCCGSSGNEAYCMGEADILIEYTAPLSPSGLFEPKGGRPGSWQALLAFPFQLCGRGSLPHDSACRVELGALNWTMVASRAIELETAIHISYDLPSAPGAADSGAEEQEAAVPSGDGDMIYRDRGKAERERGGDWQMVTLNEDDKRERPQVEIVDLSGGAEPGKIRQAIADVLTREAWEEQGTDRQSADEADETAEGYRISRSLAVKVEQADGTEQPPEKRVAEECPEECPEEDPLEECPEEESPEEECSEEECPEEEYPEEECAAPIEERLEECAVPANAVEDAPQASLHAARSGPAVQVSFNGKMETAPEAGPDGEPTPGQNAPGFAPDLPLPLPETVIRPDHDQDHDHDHHDAPHHDAADQPRESPVPLPGPVPEPHEPYQAQGEPQAVPSLAEPQPQAEALAAAVSDDPEPLEPQPLPRPKRRFRGVPGLHVEAHDNDIDVTAFHISIKL